MQGIFINGARPKSKKAIKEALAQPADYRVRIEATSVFGNEFGGSIDDLPANVRVDFVGPDPHTKRNFYGSLIKKPNGDVVVK